MFNLDSTVTNEFFGVYKGILPEHAHVCYNMVSGACVALEVCGDKDVVNRVRELCGPHDP
jgi:nucleoside-diphosphate kinase